MNDEDLLRQVRRDDPEAIRRLIQRFYPSVLRFLATLCLNQDDAEELTQEVFVKALTHLNKFRGSSSIRTWLHSIAFHEYTHRRRLERMRQICLGDRKTNSFSVSSLLAIDLERALGSISEELRAVFVLCDVQELTMQETACVLRVPVGTIKSRLHTARKRLQELLEPEQEVNIHVSRI